jgi:hypothetical protein
MRFLARIVVFLALATLVADTSLLGQRQGGPNTAGRQTGPDAGGRGRPVGAPDADGRGRGRGRGQELRTGTSSIRGRVVNATTGSPVRRASIQATYYADQAGRGEPPRTETTDDNGAFLFTNLPAGRWALRASKNGYIEQLFGQRSAFATVDPIPVAEGQQVVADFRLSRGGAFSGRIVDEFGDPVAGANVTALRFQVTPQGTRTTRTGTSVPSDDTGAYRIYGLPPGQYYVSVNDPSASRTILVADRGNSLDAFRVESPDSTVTGLVSGDASGIVSFSSAATRTSYAPTYYPGTSSLADAQRLTLGPGEEQPGINLAIIPVRTARVTGRVIGSNGSPLPATVTLSNQMGQTFSVNTGRDPGSDGTFTLANIPPGSFTLEALGPSVGAAAPEVSSMPLVINGQDILGLQITTGSGGRVTGTVVSDNGMRLPASNVRVTAVPVRGFVPTATVNSSGTFELEGLAGVYTLRFESLPSGWAVKSVTANGVDVSDAAVEFRPGDRVAMRVELTDRVTQVTGTVRSDRAVNGATVIVFADEPEKWTTTSRFIKTARLADGGQFTVRGLPPHSRYLAVAVDFMEPGEAQNPDFLQRAKKVASATFALSAGDQRILDLPLIIR